MPATPTCSAVPRATPPSAPRPRRWRRPWAAAPEEVFVASTGVIGERLPVEKITARVAELVDGPARRRHRGGRRRDHDHRHLPQGCGGQLPTIDGVPVTHRRDRQGLGHDRARHGDHAGLRGHRRGPAGRRCCRRCSARRPTPRSTRSPSTATPRPRTRCCCSRPGRPAIAPVAGAGRSARSPTSGGAARRCCSIWRIRSCATARVRRSSSRSRSRVPSTPPRRGGSASRSRIRRWSRPRSPAATPTGAG